MNRLVRFLVMLVVAFALIGLINWLDLSPMINLGGLLIILVIVVVFLLRKASKNSNQMPPQKKQGVR